MQVYRSPLVRCISSSHVRFVSADAAKSSVQRLAASWDDIHIPSRTEVKQAQRTGSLSSRLAARRPNPASFSATPNVPTPTVIPVAPNQAASVVRRTGPPKRVLKPAPPMPARKPDVTLQSAADTLDDLFQVIPDESSSRNDSWEKGLETMKQTVRSPSRPRNVNGRSWTPEGGNKVTGRVNTTPRVARNAGTGNQKISKSSREEEDDKRSLSAESNVEDDEDAEIYLDDTVIDGVSLLAPRPGQPAQLWYESIIKQNREPDGPRVIYPDIDISADLHDLFGVDSAQHRSIMVSNLGALNRGLLRPAVKKGKVDYQVRKVMRRYGGDYSHLQPNLVPTELRKKMRPSQLARLTMSRRNEASATQRKTFDALISSTLKNVDTVEQPIRA
ncbi:uncharacterized protein C8R40DRAFT_1164418 [Lentinula edodes]|uniref:uncharacterized protein n=1 Tax=Lentinula edodes TaxID=5353 RepID=UPI001E8DCE9A|nr:uncharacterized protein C8R40DRAFT_1164418 [Lentinula edodes]KAH7880994.1 hypothetical protein C8R40DRAFT_1164418 [Lentinula edodes]